MLKTLPAEYDLLSPWAPQYSQAGGLISDVRFDAACQATAGCDGSAEYVCSASITGGQYGGPEPKYFYRAEPGEILHVHSVSCVKCGKHTDYTGDGVHA